MFDDSDHPAVPERTIPCFLHTDEGRGLKQTPVLVAASAGALGRGTLKQRRLVGPPPDKMGLNFAGETQGNRMVHIAVPKPWPFLIAIVV